MTLLWAWFAGLVTGGAGVAALAGLWVQARERASPDE